MTMNDDTEMARILVADDDRLVLATLSAGLRELGYEILEAASGDEAVRICATEKPDLAILDMRMPGMSGVEAASRIARDSGVPFIFLSAYDDADFVNQAVAEGALGYLVKPVTAPQIVPTIEAALSRSSDLEYLKQKKEDLSSALNAGREISIAIGLIMGETGMGTDEAESALRQYARSHRRKMSEVAADVVSAKQVFTTLIRDIQLMVSRDQSMSH